MYKILKDDQENPSILIREFEDFKLAKESFQKLFNNMQTLKMNQDLFFERNIFNKQIRYGLFAGKDGYVYTLEKNL